MATVTFPARAKSFLYVGRWVPTRKSKIEKKVEEDLGRYSEKIPKSVKDAAINIAYLESLYDDQKKILEDIEAATGIADLYKSFGGDLHYSFGLETGRPSRLAGELSSIEGHINKINE